MVENWQIKELENNKKYLQDINNIAQSKNKLCGI